MRTSEWFQTGFAALLAFAAWMTVLGPAPLPIRRRWNITFLAVIAIAAVAAVVGLSSYLQADTVSILRDWLTVPLFLIPYWQAGQFFLKPNPAIERRLLLIDQRLLPRISATSGTDSTGIGFFLEMAYLSCYPLVPAGLLAMYVTGQRQHVPSFWLVVLIATYICYGATPFVPAYPPRSLSSVDLNNANSVNKGRTFNRWILRHGSIHAISFPSAHVASAFAVALVLLRFSLPAGLLFLIFAIAISFGAVIGRYHYALDVLSGAALAIVVFLATYPWL